jgi:hypothetical protein
MRNILRRGRSLERDLGGAAKYDALARSLVGIASERAFAVETPLIR